MQRASLERLLSWMVPLLGVACAEESAASSAAQVLPEAAPADWPMHRGGPSLAGVATGALPRQPALLWSYAAEGAITSSPAVVGERVFVGADDGFVHAIDVATGEAVWTFETDDIIEAPPLVVGGTVFIGSSDFYFYAIDAATGELRWKYETDDKILGGANVVPGDDRVRVVVGSYDARLYCFDAETGEKLWVYETDNYVNGTPAVLGDRIVFGGCDAVLHVVSARTGEALTSVALGDECHVAGSVALADGRVYFGHYGNAFVCIDLESGELVWTYGERRQPYFSSPAIGDELIVFGGRDKKLHAARRDTGEPVWQVKTRRKVDGSPVMCGDEVLFGSEDGRLYIVDLATGAERWTYDIGDSIVSSPAVWDGRFFVGANDGRLYAFGDAQPLENGTQDVDR